MTLPNGKRSSGDTLREPRRIAIIGGGPSGALAGLQLRRLAQEAGRELDVLIFDRRQFGVTGPRGCNMCAGVVSKWLIARLEEVGVPVPATAIQRRIQSYTVVVPGAQVRLPTPPGARIYTAFRSGGPMGEEYGTERSLDHLLLQAAVTAGAQHVRRVVQTVRLPDDRQGPVVLVDAEGQEHEADAVIGAFGVNSTMRRTFEELGFGYRAPRTAMAAQCEIRLSPEEIETLFEDGIKCFWLGIPGVSLAAMVPKERHVTVTLVGRHVGQADLEQFLRLPEVRAFLPPDWELADQYCHCHPRLPITAARNVVTDRVVVVGDAHVSRYLKNGLDSAFITASLAAEAILAGGVGRESLRHRYVRPCRALFAWDNRCGRLLFALHGSLGETPSMAAAQMRLVAREQQSPGPRALSAVLWGMMTGDEAYATVLRWALSPRLHWRLAWEVIAGRRTPSPSPLAAGPSGEPTRQEHHGS